MKNRRIVLAAFLLIAVLVMGVGFAELIDNLFIKGEATITTESAQPLFDQKVHFVAASADGSLKSERVSTTGNNAIPEGGSETVTIGSSDPDSATFHVHTLGKKDDVVIFSFVIQNESDTYDALISLDEGSPAVSGAAAFFTLEYSVDQDTWYNLANQAQAPVITCEAEGYTQVFARITLVQTPSKAISAAFNINLTAKTPE